MVFCWLRAVPHLNLDVRATSLKHSVMSIRLGKRPLRPYSLISSVGFIALFSGKTGEIITLSVFGARCALT